MSVFATAAAAVLARLRTANPTNSDNQSPRRSYLREILADRLDHPIAENTKPERDGYTTIEKYKNWRRGFLRDDARCTNQP